MDLIIIKRSISDTTYGGVPSCGPAKELIDVIGQKFKEYAEAKVENLLNNFTNIR